ncbi:ATP-binding protein [Allomuricauda sp. NBRC 101325]|uniref:ATP-binding protein n=1 Tax=Allomuricauda sp. NBRC 101325 TaxID=1113758 RepID=UPI002555F0B9|nr:ATP-binding protein [Muricauda sp. NBRC 101325]
MIQLRIKDVDLKIQLFKDKGIVEDQTSGKMAMDNWSDMTKTNILKCLSIQNFNSLGSKRAFYQIPYPRLDFPAAPSNTMEFDAFLERSIKLTKAIMAVHQADCCFGVLRNDRIMLGPNNELIVLGIGLLQKSYSKNDLNLYQEDDFYFLAPEFSKRSNKLPDKRSDLYGLGTLLHYWLTGTHLIKALDKQEVLHKHLTETYRMDAIQSPWRESGIYSIIKGLVEKNPDERYQSAHGILKDLLQIRLELTSKNPRILTELSLKFNPGTINFTDKLYERQDALNELEDRYKEVCNGASAIVFLEGASGLGKTALGKTFESKIADKSTLFSMGSFDEGQSTPYKAFQQAFHNIAQRILLKSGKSHAEVRDVFVSGLGTDLTALFQVIPDLKELTGNLPQPEPLDPLETGDRFVNLFARYCRTLDGIGLKRVVFIDDVQWCDLSSLKLLEYMAWAPISRVMFILSYNPDGLTDEHPLRIFQQSLFKVKKASPIIKLHTLGERATYQMVAEALSEEGNEIRELARLVFKKTHGNPYYIKHFIKSLQEDNVLWYDLVQQRWMFNIERAQIQEMADNVLAIHEEQLLLQSYQAQVLLKVAAYDNGRFNIPLLATICKFPKEIVQLLLELLTDAGQLSRLDTEVTSYAFGHNRIQQAAFHLKIPGFERTHEQLHLAVAQFYLDHGKPEATIHLNQLVEHLIQSRELLDLETVNKSLNYILRAGQVANDSNSPSTALEYLGFAKDLQEKYQLNTYSFELLFGLAKASYLMRELKNARSFSEQALQQALTLEQQAEVHLLNLKFQEAYSLYIENFMEGAKVLKALGTPLGDKVPDKTEIESEYRKFTKALPDNLQEILEKSFASTPRNRYISEVLVNMCSSAQRNNQDIYTLILLKLGNRMLTFGCDDSTSFVLVHLGTLLCSRFGSFGIGSALGNLGLQLLEKNDSDKFYSKTLSVYHSVLGPLQFNYETLNQRLEIEIERCIDRGDIQGSQNLQYAKIRNQLLTGTDLGDILHFCNTTLESGNIHNSVVFTTQLQLFKTVILTLKGFDSKAAAEANQKTIELLKICNCKNTEATFHILMGWALCIKGKFQKALHYYNLHEPLLQYATIEPQYFRYQIVLSICELMSMGQYQQEVLDRVASRQEQLMEWTKIMPVNFMAEFQIIGLLLDCKSGADQNMTQRIEEVLKWTEKGNQIAIKALLTHVLHLALPKNNTSFLRQALKDEADRSFAIWGVYRDGKSSLLEEHSNSIELYRKRNSFDFQSLIKATQTISAEVNKDRLVQNLLQIVMENAGADKGALILSNNSKLSITAYIDLTKPDTSPFTECDLDDCAYLPTGLVEHVVITKRELCIENLASYCNKEKDVITDNTGSMLLMPLIKQGDLVGVLYVVNSQITGMFTEGGLEVLRIIASQAAISITNSILYEKAITLNQELASSEKKLAKLNHALEEKIRERTQHLRHEIEMRKEAERDLIFAKNDADNANRAKSQFLANMSHEIRTPLNAIVGFSQILTNQSKSLELTNSFRRYLNNIYQSAESLSEIIRDILDLSKIEAGKTTLMIEDMDLRQLFFSVYRIQSSLAKSKEVKIVYHLAPGAPRFIQSDRGKIKQILMNIVGNAVKFTPSQNKIKLGLDAIENCLVFTISDEGIGIPTEDLERIFEPFTQSDAGMDRKYGGTGLGLTITKSLVDILGGQLTVESKEGVGTCFTVRIPFELAAPMQSNFPETILANYRVPEHSKILVVEDNPMNQEMIRALFSELGSEILLASNGKESVVMTERFVPDIIFMDIHMPEMDGFETLKLIRKSNPLIPVIGLSADAFKEHQDAALMAGFSAYLTKPIQIAKIVALLKEFLPNIDEKLLKSSPELDEAQLNHKFHALEAIRKLPIFETEKLVEVAATLGEVLPPESMSRLEDAIYTGDERALHEFLTNTLHA